MRTAKLSKKSARWVKKLGDEEGAIQYVWGSRSDGGRDSLTVWDNVLTVWEAAGGKDKLAGLILAQEASYKNW
jgi:hypothetical protein